MNIGYNCYNKVDIGWVRTGVIKPVQSLYFIKVSVYKDIYRDFISLKRNHWLCYKYSVNFNKYYGIEVYRLIVYINTLFI